MASLATKTLALTALLGLSACESMTLVNEPLPPVDASTTTAPPKKDAGSTTAPRRDASTGAPTGMVPSEPGNGDVDPAPGDEGDDVATDPAPRDDGGMTMPVDPVDPIDPVDPVDSKIKGSALDAKCSSYGLAKDGQCAGYYCGVTIDDIRAELRTDSLCDPNPEKICDGGLTREVGKCARETKSNPLNALDSEEMIRAKVQACILKNAAYADTDLECLGCFLDAAQCASDNCLTQCLTGDSATCDQCRLDNDCNQTVPSCAGFPSPF